MSTTLAPQNPLSYMGVKPPFPPNVLDENRSPTTLDTNYDLGTIWVNSLVPMIFMLANVNGNVATWLPLGGGAVDVQTLTGNSGGMVFPTLGNIDVVGDNASGIDVVGNPGTSTLTIFNTTGLPFSQFQVDASTPPGTDPVLPDATGEVTITGGQVATGTIGANVIRTNSVAANAFTIEIQRTTTSAIADSTLNGVAHFDSTDFTVDADGFVQLVGASGFVWNEILVMGPTSMVANNGYVTNNAGLVSLTLPLTAAFGTIIRVAGKGAGGWLIAQNAGQNIQVGNVSSTPGAGGSVASTNAFDAIELLCTTADTTWTQLSSVGALNIT